MLLIVVAVPVLLFLARYRPSQRETGRERSRSAGPPARERGERPPFAHAATGRAAVSRTGYIGGSQNPGVPMRRAQGGGVKEGPPRGRVCPQCGKPVLEKEVRVPSLHDDGRYLNLVCSACDWRERRKI